MVDELTQESFQTGKVIVRTMSLLKAEIIYFCNAFVALLLCLASIIKM